MRKVRIIQAVKTDAPHYICGDVNAVLTLTDAAAEFAVTQGYAVDGGHVQSHVEAPVVAGPAEPVGSLQKLGEESSQSAPADDDSEVKRALDNAPEPPEPPKRPYGNAPKSAWAEYAAAVDPDMSVDRATGMSKADLMSQYGQRL